MSDEIAKAAGRLRRLKEHERGDYHYLDGVEGSYEHQCDCELIADAYLAERDDKPITEEWLRGLGFDIISDGAGDGWRAMRLWATCTLIVDYDGWCAFMQPKAQEIVVPKKIRKQGDVLRLLDALGLTPEGKPNGQA